VKGGNPIERYGITFSGETGLDSAWRGGGMSGNILGCQDGRGEPRQKNAETDPLRTIFQRPLLVSCAQDVTREQDRNKSGRTGHRTRLQSCYNPTHIL
jgi:hypothetical protein